MFPRTLPIRQHRALRWLGRRPDDGMSTVEYAIGTIAAAAFAAVLYTVVTGDAALAGLKAMLQRAFSVNL